MKVFFCFLATVYLFVACENASQQKHASSDAGTQSCQCLEGKQGLSGKDGAPGLPGQAGTKGDKGDAGQQGIQGISGAQGVKGEIGTQGLPGSDGTSCVAQSVPEGVSIICGATKSLVKNGDAGSTGSKGEKGDQGDVGLQGLKGDQGLSGAQGIQGIAGKDGAKGDKGDVGPQGAPGKDYVASCPVGSTPVMLDGVLVYCYAIQPEKVGEINYTWTQCLKACAVQKMEIASIQGLVLGCMANKKLFADTKLYAYYVSWQNHSYPILVPHGVIGAEPKAPNYLPVDFCVMATQPNFSYAYGDGTGIEAPGFAMNGGPGGNLVGLSASNTYGCICGHQPF